MTETPTGQQTPQQHLYAILNMAGDMGVSDVHVHPNDGIWTLNKDGLVHYTDPSVQVTQAEITAWLSASESGDAQKADPLGDKGHASVAFDTGKWRIRGTFRKSVGGTSCTFRLIPATVPNADVVGVPRIVQDLVKRSAGLILVEGPTGSGKTTAIASLIDLINRTTAQHIYLVEHPIEFMHTPKMSLFTQREIGVHASDYATAIEDALRSKPNVIVIGEMLNPATARAALHAATTGHLVITTAHAGSVAEAIDSFIGQFTADEQPQIRSRLAQSLLAIMVQKLVPAIGGGKAAVRELMINDPNFSEVIKTGQMHMVRAQMEGTKGAFSLEDSLAELYSEGRITEETAYAQASSTESLTEKMERLR
jgi:twitching motility protein PilT